MSLPSLKRFLSFTPETDLHREMINPPHGRHVPREERKIVHHSLDLPVYRLPARSMSLAAFARNDLLQCPAPPSIARVDPQQRMNHLVNERGQDHSPPPAHISRHVPVIGHIRDLDLDIRLALAAIEARVRPAIVHLEHEMFVVDVEPHPLLTSQQAVKEELVEEEEVPVCDFDCGPPLVVGVILEVERSVVGPERVQVGVR